MYGLVVRIGALFSGSDWVRITRSVCRSMENTGFPKTYGNHTLLFSDFK